MSYSRLSYVFSINILPFVCSNRRRTKHKHKHREKDGKDHRPRSQSHANPATQYPQTNDAHHHQPHEKHVSILYLYLFPKASLVMTINTFPIPIFSKIIVACTIFQINWLPVAVFIRVFLPANLMVAWPTTVWPHTLHH